MSSFFLRTSRLLLLCAGGLLLAACEYNKYPEGPTTTVFTAKDRVTSDWRWKLALVNDENQTGLLRDSILTFNEDQTLSVCPREGEGACTEGEWALVTKRSKLNLIMGQQARAYEIELLRRDEMWLTFEDDSLRIRWELEAND